MNDLGLTLGVIAFLLLFVVSIIFALVMIVGYGNNDKQGFDSEFDKLAKSKGYYRLTQIEKWLILKCDNTLCKVTSLIFWAFLLICALYSMYSIGR